MSKVVFDFMKANEKGLKVPPEYKHSKGIAKVEFLDIPLENGKQIENVPDLS